MKAYLIVLASAWSILQLVGAAPVSSFISATSGTHQSGGEHYLVLFSNTPSRKRSVRPQIIDVLSRIDLTPEHEDVHTVFNSTLMRGFSANMKAHCIDALNAMDDVAYVEKVTTFRTQLVASTSDTGTWGLQALSSAPGKITNTQSFTHPYTVAQDSTLGQGADIYVLDTGVFTDHIAFEGRAQLTSLTDSQVDDDGHGTHVAGTAAGGVFGVAQKANVHGIKVLGADGSGNTATIAQGLDMVADLHEQRKTQPGFVGSVINMSLNGGQSQAMNSLVAELNNRGIHVVVAAGNDGQSSANNQDDACNYSPASAGGNGGNAISVGAINSKFQRSSFSNTGSCVDVYAPGEQIVSSWPTGTNAVKVLAGTSMASPHVAGLVAYNMASNSSLAQDPAAMKQFIRDTALSGVLTGTTRDGDPRLLANNGFVG